MFVNYAHRGASEYYPENTFSSFYAGIDMRANGIETDVQRTKDGVLVLYHDDTLEAKTGAKGAIKDYTCEELMAFRVRNEKYGREDGIVIFEDFLRYIGRYDLTFAIELKVRGIAKDVIELAEKYGIKEKMIITSFIYEELMDAHKLGSGIRIGYLYPDNPPDIIEKLRAIGACQACPKAIDVTKEDVDALKKAGFEVRAWGIFDTDVMQMALEKGFDGGMTVNFPDKLRDAIEK